MAISIDFNTPVIRIPGFETKYDFAGVSNSLVRIFDDYLEARILQQFHFWLWLKKGGVILRGFKWIYKALIKLMDEAVVGFTEYQMRKTIANLLDKGILIRKQLHREHHGAKHASSSYNRQYYYRIDYDALVQFIQHQTQKFNWEIIPPRHVLAETTETKGLVNTTDQICDSHEPDLRMSRNTSDTTFKVNHSKTRPYSPPNLKNEGEKTKQSKNKNTTEKPRKQNSSNLHVPSPKKVKSSTTPFTDVIARPLRVEQKINQNKDTIPEDVQETVQVEDVQETVQVEVLPSESKPKANKVRKGTKPNEDFGLAPWKSLSQFKQFYRALIKKLPIVANSRSPQGLANKIIQQLRDGVPHSYWDDFVNGLPIGTSTQQEWEVEPGVPHPMFIEYLTEKLIKGNNSQTREQAILQALNIVSSPKQAIFFWKECKISLGNALSEAERHRALGVQALPTPLWTKERPEPTLEEAAIAGTKIARIHSSTQAAIEATKNRQIEGSTQEIEASLHKKSNTPVESDPWVDEETPSKKPKLSDYLTDDLKRLFKQHSDKTKAKSVRSKLPQLDELELRREPLRISKMNLGEINKALTDPILRAELTPQLMLSDYELIKDEMGRIIRIEDVPF